MKTSSIAALLVGIVGLLLIVISILTAAYSVISGIIPDGVVVTGGEDGPTSIFVIDEGVVYAILGWVMVLFLIGIGLIVASKPLGRWIAKGSPEQSADRLGGTRAAFGRTMRAFLVIYLQAVFWLAATIAIQMLLAICRFDGGFRPSTPPGHQGLTFGFGALIAAACLILYWAARVSRSIAPAIIALLVMAAFFSDIPWIDSRTPIRIAYGHLSLWQVYGPVVYTAIGILTCGSLAIAGGRFQQHVNTRRPKCDPEAHEPVR